MSLSFDTRLTETLVPLEKAPFGASTFIISPFSCFSKDIFSLSRFSSFISGEVCFLSCSEDVFSLAFSSVFPSFFSSESWPLFFLGSSTFLSLEFLSKSFFLGSSFVLESSILPSTYLLSKSFLFGFSGFLSIGFLSKTVFLSSSLLLTQTCYRQPGANQQRL